MENGKIRVHATQDILPVSEEICLPFTHTPAKPKNPNALTSRKLTGTVLNAMSLNW